LALLFLFFVFFPYLAIVPLGTDLQPNALLTAVLLLFVVSSWRWPVEIWLLAVPIAASFLIALAQFLSFSAVRGVGAYATPFFVAAATYSVLKSRPRMADAFIKYAPYAWLAVGLIQQTVNQDFLKFLIPNMTTDVDRGVTSLATEPSFYGIFCVFLLVLNYLRNPRDKLTIVVLLVQILFLARSAVSVVILFLLLVYVALVRLSIKQIVLCALAAGIGYYLISNLLPEEWRIVTLTAALMSDPSLLLLTDTSVNARFGHFLFSLLGSLQSGFLPHGYGPFTQYVSRELAVGSLDYTWLGSLDDSVKIMSGYGSAFFELGFVGILYAVSITVAAYKYYRRDLKSFLVLASFIHTVLFAAVQISLPIVGFLIGYLSFYGLARSGNANRPSVRQLQPRNRAG
jgi:hypothetical protein